MTLHASTNCAPCTLPPSRVPGAAWRLLAAGFLANAAFSAAISGLPAAGVALRAGYGLSTADLGLALGAVGLGIAVSELPWGLLTDRLGDRRVLLSGLALTAAVLGGMAVAAAPPGVGLAPLVVGLAGVGLAGGSVNGASGRAVMRGFPEGRRGFAMGVRQTALPLGGAVGAVVVPWVAAGAGFAATYSLLAATCLASAAACAAWVPATAEAPGDARPGDGPAPLRRLDLWCMAAGIGVLCIAQIAVLSFVAVFLHDRAGFGLVATSAAMATYQVGAAALRVASGLWTDRRRNRPAFLRGCCAAVAAVIGALAVMTEAFGAVPSSAEGALLLAGVVLGGVAASCWHGVAFTELATRAGSRHVGTVLGLGNTFAFGAYFLTPLAVPWVVATAGWSWAWGAVAACALFALPLLGRRRRND